MSKKLKIIRKEIFKNDDEEEREKSFTKMWLNLIKSNYDITNDDDIIEEVYDEDIDNII